MELLQVMAEVESFTIKRVKWVMFLISLTAPKPSTLHPKQYTLADVVNEFEKRAALAERRTEWSLKYLLDDLYSLNISYMQKKLLQGEWLTGSTIFDSATLDQVHHNPDHEQTTEQKMANDEVEAIKLEASHLIGGISKVDEKYNSLGLSMPYPFKIDDEKWRNHRNQLQIDQLPPVEKELKDVAFSFLQKKQNLYALLSALATQKIQYETTEADVLRSLVNIKHVASTDSGKWLALIDLLKSWNDQQKSIAGVLAKMDGILFDCINIQQGWATFLMQQMSESSVHKSLTATDRTHAFTVATPAANQLAKLCQNYHLRNQKVGILLVDCFKLCVKNGRVFEY